MLFVTVLEASDIFETVRPVDDTRGSLHVETNDGFATVRAHEVVLSDLLAELHFAVFDRDRRVRLEALSELAVVGTDSSAALASAALADEDASVREEAAYTLGEIGGEIAIDLLGQALQDPDAGVRGAAVDAIAEIGGFTGTRLLQQALADEQFVIREAAGEYLAELSTEEP